MSLKPFTYPFPETRFLHAGSNVYKFKIRYGNSIRREEIENKEVIIQELEDSIRAVLGNLDNLLPFVTEHFIVFPYKSKWERVSHLKFKHGEIILIPYPFVFTLYVEMKWFHENLSPGKPINNSPLGLVLAEKKAAEATMRKRKFIDEPSLPSSSEPQRAEMGTSSQDPSKKKPPMETRRDPQHDELRNKHLHMQSFNTFPCVCCVPCTWGIMFSPKNREREAQQEWQETPASDTTDVQEQDFKWGHSMPGTIVPPMQQNNPTPPKEQGTSGFFGFLSALFPFRYFFRKSSQ